MYRNENCFLEIKDMVKVYSTLIPIRIQWLLVRSESSQSYYCGKSRNLPKRFMVNFERKTIYFLYKPRDLWIESSWSWTIAIWWRNVSPMEKVNFTFMGHRFLFFGKMTSFFQNSLRFGSLDPKRQVSFSL